MKTGQTVGDGNAAATGAKLTPHPSAAGSGMLNDSVPSVEFALAPAPVWSSLPPTARQRVRFLTTRRMNGTSPTIHGHNFGLHVGDDASEVLARRRLLAQACETRPVWMQQVHGTECAHLSPDHAGGEPVDALTADAAFTRHTGLACVVMTADCLPVLLTDGQGSAVAAAHCGWRGLLDGVLDTTLDAFASAGLTSGTLHAWLGPCIGADSFEVGSEVREAFMKQDLHNQAFFKPHPRNETKWLADLQRLASHALQRRYPVTIDRDTRDTYTHVDLNSFRRNKVTGRQATLIWLCSQ